jgi:hypothetical protein
VSELLDQIHCPPTDLEKVCEKQRVSIHDSTELLGSGALVKDGEYLQILCAPDLSPERRRFTIAHELGHLIVGRSSPLGVRQSREVERLCDLFAAELLMPRPVFAEAIGRGARLRDLPGLARSFQVSLTSALIRYAELTGVSIFEVREDRIVWGVGVIRHGPVRDLDDGLKPAIAKAIEGQAGSDQIYLTIRESIWRCEAEYLPLGKSKRALILIRALPRL